MNRTIIIGLTLLLTLPPLHARKFFDDDPLAQEPKPRSAEKAARRKISDYFDFFQQMFASPGEKLVNGKPVPAQAVNTLGEPIDPAWWNPRHYYAPMSLELRQGARIFLHNR